MCRKPPPCQSPVDTSSRHALAPPFAHDFLDPTLLPASLSRRLRCPAGRYHHLVHLHDRRFTGIGRAGPKTYSQLFFGHDLSKQGTSENLFGDAALSIQLQVGYLGGDSSQIQEYGLQRTAALAVADQLKLPAPTRDELANHIRGLQAFAGPDGQFDANRYASYRDSIKANPRNSEADVSRVLNDDVRFTQVRRILGGPGYVLPGEIREQLIRADSKWTIAVATTDYADFKPEIPVAEDALKRYLRRTPSATPSRRAWESITWSIAPATSSPRWR